MKTQFVYNGLTGTIDDRRWIEYNGIGFYLKYAHKALKALLAGLLI